MRIPTDIMIEILKIKKENYEYKKKIAKEKYGMVICELGYIGWWKLIGRYYTTPIYYSEDELEYRKYQNHEEKYEKEEEVDDYDELSLDNYIIFIKLIK